MSNRKSAPQDLEDKLDPPDPRNRRKSNFRISPVPDPGELPKSRPAKGSLAAVRQRPFTLKWARPGLEDPPDLPDPMDLKDFKDLKE